ncbi:hypothetical protein [Gymnodinialimonas ceratoperidinii]|uniref:Protease inhibitor Inh n=1 Tax=Gymnodinialimonas ceratoperidinii TaxID=2856823 RepID=A0A8F6TTC3_9RHOB|nr:hypothetical protein [Gymnodinialimonas ceratoperidinii]QXT38577.1 hypothetical protein KYE46_11585 [Gymnodinialimonas ceratoperidinii]
MRRTSVLLLALATTLPVPAMAEIPAWMLGEWSTTARLTAPDGARLRIRCTLDAAAASEMDWGGTLGCATVQGRFEGQWQVAVDGTNAQGAVVFSGAEDAQMDVMGIYSETRMELASDDGQGVAFAPGPDGALVVEMTAMGPQRLTGTLTFESR